MSNAVELSASVNNNTINTAKSELTDIKPSEIDSVNNKESNSLILSTNDLILSPVGTNTNNKSSNNDEDKRHHLDQEFSLSSVGVGEVNSSDTTTASKSLVASLVLLPCASYDKEANHKMNLAQQQSNSSTSSSSSSSSSSSTSSSSSSHPQQTSPAQDQMPLVVSSSTATSNPSSIQYFQYPNGIGTSQNVSPLSSSLTSSPSATSNNTPTSTIPPTAVSFTSTHQHHLHTNASIGLAHHSHPHPVSSRQTHLNSIGLATVSVAPQQQQTTQVHLHPSAVSSHIHHSQQFHAFNPNFKDTRWLTLEVCREFQRAKCQRSDSECKFAHPPPHVEVTNGKVIACYDSLKGKCSRKEPPCKYLHPPQHLKDQLLQNGKNNLVLRQVALAMMQQQHQVQQQGQVATQPGQSTGSSGHQVPHHHQHHSHQGASHQAAVAALLNGAHHPHAQHGVSSTTSMIQASPAVSAQFLFNGANNLSGLNSTTGPSAQFIPASALAQAGLTTAFPQIQLATSGAQAGIFPMIAASTSSQTSTNGYHSHHGHPTVNNPVANTLQPHHLVATSAGVHSHQHANNFHHLQSAAAGSTSFLTDHNGIIHQVSNASLLAAAAAAANGASPGAVAATANGLLAPQQRTDRLPQGNELSDPQATSASFSATFETGTPFQMPQFQIYTTAPIYQRASVNSNAASGQNSLNEELNASASVTANAAAANVVDVVQGKKRPHDAIEQDLISLQSIMYQGGSSNTATGQLGSSNALSSGNGSNISVKRTALTDAKTGMPVFQPQQPTALHQLHQGATTQNLALPASAQQQPSQPLTALNYPINFPLQYTPYISLPYTGHPSGIPRL